MKTIVVQGETSRIDYVTARKADAPVDGLTGVAYNSAGIAAYWWYEGGAKTALTLETITTLGTYQAPTSTSHLRLKLLHDTDVPGDLEIHYPDGWFSNANGYRRVWFVIKGVTNMLPIKVQIDITPYTEAGV